MNVLRNQVHVKLVNDVIIHLVLIVVYKHLLVQMVLKWKIFNVLVILIDYSSILFCYIDIDIDECALGNHTCLSPAICKNTYGSFYVSFHWIYKDSIERKILSSIVSMSNRICIQIRGLCWYVFYFVNVYYM